MKKEYIKPQTISYSVTPCDTIMVVSGDTSSDGLDKDGDDPKEGEDMGAKASFNIWDD